MKTLTKTQVGFKITILVDQIISCPGTIGDEDGNLVRHELTDPLYEILPLEYLQERGFSLHMTEEEICELLQDLLGHEPVYDRIADEYGEEVNDFYEKGSCIDFTVTGVEMRIF